MHALPAVAVPTHMSCLFFARSTRRTRQRWVSELRTPHRMAERREAAHEACHATAWPSPSEAARIAILGSLEADGATGAAIHRSRSDGPPTALSRRRPDWGAHQ